MTGARPYGHSRVLDLLEELSRAAQRGPEQALPHAWLFTGPRGVGKATTARWWAARLKCTRAADCQGDCPSCKQLAAGTHPDLSLIGPEEGKKDIGIDPIRSMISEMAVKPAAAGPRVAVVDPADRTTHPAQSAILKLLEEPPGWAVIILVSANPSALLETIRSRCQRIGFGRLSEKHMLAVLATRGIEGEDARARLAVSGHNLGLAASRAAAELEELAALRQRVGTVDDADTETLASALAELRKKDPSVDELLLDWSAQGLREQVRRGESGVEAEAAANALSALGRNANPRLALRTLLLGRARLPNDT